MDKKTFDNEIIDANQKLFIRYLEIIKHNQIPKIGQIDKDYLIKFCDLAIKKPMQSDKSSRWLGFVQGILFTLNLIDIEEERSVSRELFHEIYNKFNIIQETISVNHTNGQDGDEST